MSDFFCSRLEAFESAAIGILLLIIMAKLESFGNLAKSQEDLIKKDFCFSQLFALSFYGKTSQMVNFKGSFKQLLDNDHRYYNESSAYFNYKSPQISLKQEFQTAKVYKTTLEVLPESQKQLKGKLEIEENREEGLSKKSISVEYTQEKVKGKIAITNDKLIKVTAVGLFKAFGAGLDLGLDIEAKRICNYNAALFISTDDYKLILKHTSMNKKAFTLGSITGSLFYRVSQIINVAGVLTYNTNKQIDIKSAIQYSIDKTKVFKARVDNEGVIGISMRNQISPLVTLVTGTQFSLFDFPTPHLQFGFRLKFNQ